MLECINTPSLTHSKKLVHLSSCLLYNLSDELLVRGEIICLQENSLKKMKMSGRKDHSLHSSGSPLRPGNYWTWLEYMDQSEEIQILFSVPLNLYFFRT